MLVKFWRIILELIARLANRVATLASESRREREPFARKLREINIFQTAVARKSATSTSTAIRVLPTGLTKYSDAYLSEKAQRKQDHDFKEIIEVICVDGEFLSQTLQVRTSNRKSPWAIFSLAFIMIAALALSIVNRVPQSESANVHTASIGPDGGRKLENATTTLALHDKEPSSNMTKALQPISVITASSTIQQDVHTSLTETPSRSIEQMITAVPEEPLAAEAKEAAESGSRTIDRVPKSADVSAKVHGRSALVVPSNMSSQKVKVENNDSTFPAARNLSSTRSQKVKAHQARGAHAPSRNVPDVVLNGLLGGLAGAVVGGPVGLVAGAAVGASAGSAIAHSWGIR